MTHKVFWEDPYLTALETRIASVEGAEVTVEATIFYALSGGQESDHGTIADQPVLAARKAGRQIVYTLEPSHALKPGDRVTIAIDWQRRYRLMRLHFAAEIILELVTRSEPSIAKIGAHIAQEKARIDFAWPASLAPMLPRLAAEAHRIVAEDQDILSAFSDVANERRYWKIRDFAAVPCGGTHLRRTGEIGEIALKRKNIGKGKERIEIYVA
ncbi:MAG: alanyl-tRNA editing protein [Alphaproteobacteria bacterium]|nr:alanyl-tRNA editing protein [Alphaproteobacteria bacterium]